MSVCVYPSDSSRVYYLTWSHAIGATFEICTDPGQFDKRGQCPGRVPTELRAQFMMLTVPTEEEGKAGSHCLSCSVNWLFYTNCTGVPINKKKSKCAAGMRLISLKLGPSVSRNGPWDCNCMVQWPMHLDLNKKSLLGWTTLTPQLLPSLKKKAS